MRLLSPASYRENIAVGQRIGSGRAHVEAEALKAFATDFDPQLFRLDEDRIEAQVSLTRTPQARWGRRTGCAGPGGCAGTMRVTGAQLAMLIEGLSEWSHVVPKVTKRPTKVG